MASVPSRSSIARLVALTALLPLLTGCLSESPGPAATGSPSPAQPVAAALVGAWTVRDVPDPDDGAVVLFDGERLGVWRTCGVHEFGAIVGSDGALRTSLQGGYADCDVDSGLSWVDAATRIAAQGDDLELQGPDGVRLATLERGGTPKVPESVDPSVAETPVLTDELAARLTAPPLDLPDGLTPVTEAQLTGARWFPARHAPSAPEGSWVEFDPAGTWRGSDGCNGQGSVWLLEASGWFRAAGFAQTAIGCSGVAVGSQLTSSAALAVNADGMLVALTPDGTEAGRFVRDIRDSKPDPALEF